MLGFAILDIFLCHVEVFDIGMIDYLTLLYFVDGCIVACTVNRQIVIRTSRAQLLLVHIEGDDVLLLDATTHNIPGCGGRLIPTCSIDIGRAIGWEIEHHSLFLFYFHATTSRLPGYLLLGLLLQDEIEWTQLVFLDNVHPRVPINHPLLLILRHLSLLSLLQVVFRVLEESLRRDLILRVLVRLISTRDAERIYKLLMIWRLLLLLLLLLLTLQLDFICN